MNDDKSFYVYIFRNIYTDNAIFVGTSSNLHYGYNHYRSAYKSFQTICRESSTSKYSRRLRHILEQSGPHFVEIFRSNLSKNEASEIRIKLIDYYNIELQKCKIPKIKIEKQSNIKEPQQIYQEYIIDVPRIPKKEVDEIEVVKFYSLLNNCLTREELLQNL